MVIPSKNYIFAQQIKGEEKTKSGFLLSEKSIEEPQIAEVIAIGDSILQYKLGDKIIYKPYTTTEIKLDDQEYFLIEEIDVLGKIVNG